MTSNNEVLTVESHHGARFRNLKRTIKSKRPPKKRLADIFIICGTNDAATKRSNDKIVNDCVELLKLAKERAMNVHLSSIPPRTDCTATQRKINEINQLLATAAEENNASFVNQEKNFLFRDNSVDESLLHPIDGLHLSHKGTTKLLINMNLIELTTVKNSTTSTENVSDDNSGKRRFNAWNQYQPTSSPSSQLRTNPTTFSTSDETIFFNGEKNPLSNLHHTPITIWGMSFHSTEQAYQYRKSIELNQNDIAKEIRSTPSSHEAMKIAKKIKTDDRWQEIKINVMDQLLRTKADQCEAFKQALNSTGRKLLVENTSHDFWGRGKSDDGLNMLGRLLMTLRDTTMTTRNKNIPAENQQIWPQNRILDEYPSDLVYRRNQHHQEKMPAKRNTRMACWYCGENNHMHLQCRHGKPIQCHECGDDGHKS